MNYFKIIEILLNRFDNTYDRSVYAIFTELEFFVWLELAIRYPEL